MEKKKKIILGAGAVILAGAVGASVYFLQKDGEGENETLAYVTSVASMNDAVGAQKMAGVVESQKTQEIQKDSERQVKEILVKAGDEVDVGTPLFTYETSTLETELQQAQLDLERSDNEMANLRTQIDQLQKEKNNAGEEEQLSYTTQIQTAQMELKRTEYERKSKEVEKNRIQEKINNSTVSSEMKGVVKSVQNSGQEMNYSYDGSSQAFITILATGEYRVKGNVNEQNISEIVEGEQAIIRSRVDEDAIWRGTYTAVDTQNPSANNSSMMMYSSSSEAEQTTSTSYHFYVNLESSQGLLLGQHVYIEKDTGMEAKKGSIWLDEAYIADVTEKPYVWVENEKGTLEKRTVILGAYDEAMMQYEIQEGLKKSDYVAYPQEFIEEGTKTTHDMAESMMSQTEGEAMPEEGAEGLPEDGMEAMPEDGTEILPEEGAEALPEEGTEMLPQEESDVQEGTEDAVPEGVGI